MAPILPSGLRRVLLEVAEARGGPIRLLDLVAHRSEKEFRRRPVHKFGAPSGGLGRILIFCDRQQAPAMPSFLAFDEVGLLRPIQAPLGLLQIGDSPVQVRQACCMSRVVCSNDLAWS